MESKGSLEFHDGVCDYCEALDLKCCEAKPCCQCNLSGYCSIKYPSKQNPKVECYADDTPGVIVRR